MVERSSLALKITLSVTYIFILESNVFKEANTDNNKKKKIRILTFLSLHNSEKANKMGGKSLFQMFTHYMYEQIVL